MNIRLEKKNNINKFQKKNLIIIIIRLKGNMLLSEQ